ncbi:TIM barrel protein [Acutalibacter caecimuris]|uniref:TIM barrel protein n=1 Tax=Acutalibacter caecimuris TaxID=3093657 RepID=UPI002AC8FC37|nr:TIM barrel protein [Acutalibacter sp. M00118]
MKFGVQLYGPLQGMDGDRMAKLRALAGAGIEEIEPCLALGETPAPGEAVWPADWLAAHREEIRRLGLRVTSAHLFAQGLAGALPGWKALAKDLGLRHLVVKSPEDLSETSLHQTALRYMQAAAQLEEVGVRLLLHNEAGDIRAKIAGVTAYERLLDLCMGRVYAQVDVGWVQAGGEDPVAFLRRNAWRVKSLHYKDVGPQGGPADVPLGTGIVDLAACFGLAQAWDIPQFIDQEHFEGDVPGGLAAACRTLNGFAYSNRKHTVSYLHICDGETGQVDTVARFDRVVEAPNWLKHSDTILFNGDGRMFAFDLASGTERLLDTGPCRQCNNDHVPSPDEKSLAVSHNDDPAGYASRIYIVPMDGGEARCVTPESPSYLHGWSPDGKELAYCAFRQVEGRQEMDIYTVPAEGGPERRLTRGGFNDGPEYSPDGRHIWYNSTRSGLMQVWRMDRDGGNPVQITRNRRNNWFGHISPDGKKVVYLSYGPEQLEPQEHLPNMPVELWMMDGDGANQRLLLPLFGGQGSINVNPWAGDSRRFAFVSYELV